MLAKSWGFLKIPEVLTLVCCFKGDCFKNLVITNLKDNAQHYFQMIILKPFLREKKDKAYFPHIFQIMVLYL